MRIRNHRLNRRVAVARLARRLIDRAFLLTVAFLVGLQSISPAAAQQLGGLPETNRPRPRITDFSDRSATPYRVALQAEPVAPGVARPQGQPAEVPANPAAPLTQIPANLFGPDQIRLPLLDSSGRQIGGTPHPTPQVLQQFHQYVERRVDPQNTLDLQQARPTLIILKQAPIRIQIADENVATYTLIADTQLWVTGNAVGTTILNLWFADRQGGPPKILSYLVRVFPDTELKQRLERVYKALELEINHTFPNSVVHLALVGDKLVVSGEAKDVVDASEILRVVAANAPGNTRGKNGFQSDEIPVGQINLVTPVSAIGQAGGGQTGQLPEQGLQNFLLRNPTRNIINLLHVPGEQQVMLRVSVAEVDRHGRPQHRDGFQHHQPSRHHRVRPGDQRRGRHRHGRQSAHAARQRPGVVGNPRFAVA